MPRFGGKPRPQMIVHHNPAVIVNACNYISRRYYYSRQHRRNYFRRMRRLLPIIIVGGATVASF
jgi:hypothetical protein